MQKPEFFSENFSIKEKTYFKMGGSVRYFAQPSSLSEISETLLFAKQNKYPVAVLGLGSNCIFSDVFFDGIVISLEKFNSWEWQDDDILCAQSGLTNTEISKICLDASKDDAWWMYLMPGQVGASVRMNARCYGGEMSQVVHEVISIDQNGFVNTYKNEEIFIGYKNTRFMNQPEIIISVRYKFPNLAQKDEIQKKMNECENDRLKKNHFQWPSCGSTFKNNYEIGIPSGRIFDSLGFKGYRLGACQVSETHANFIWNLGEAKTSDFLKLTSIMKKEAKVQKGYDLNLEVQTMGLFSKEEFESNELNNLGYYIKENDNFMTGIFYHPKSLLKNISYPNSIFQSYYFSYQSKYSKDIVNLSTQIHQIQCLSDAIQNPDLPFLRWTTYNINQISSIFENSISENVVPKFTDELWKSNVSELFICHPSDSKYAEFELSSDLRWLALLFDAPRVRSIQNLTVTPEIWSGILVSRTSDSQAVTIEIPYNIIKGLISNNFIKLQCCLSLDGSRHYLAPDWSISSKAGKKDFHQPNNYYYIELN